MTPLALFALAGRAGLLLFGFLCVSAGIWYTPVFDRLSQNERLRRLFDWSRRGRLLILVLTNAFGVALLVAAVIVPTESFMGFGGDIVACSTPFWVACGIASVRMTVVELRRASRLRRQHRTEGQPSQGPAMPNGTGPLWRADGSAWQF
jgi:hypothetical protein